MLQGFENLRAPSIPTIPFGSAGSDYNSPAFQRSLGGPVSSTVTNQNTGSIGAMHFAIYNANNPREVVRSIANYMKLVSPRFSPSNT